MALEAYDGIGVSFLLSALHFSCSIEIFWTLIEHLFSLWIFHFYTFIICVSPGISILLFYLQRALHQACTVCHVEYVPIFRTSF
jgi:hypothetical protein